MLRHHNIAPYVIIIRVQTSAAIWRVVNMSISHCAWCLLVSTRLLQVIAEAPACGPVDCSELKCWGISRYTIHQVFALAPESLWLKCDFRTNGGGWTILQERRNQDVEFYRNWNAYKKGFGDGNTFWMGLDHVHRMTKGKAMTLRIEVEHGRYRQKDKAEYYGFSVGNESTAYALAYAEFDRRSSLRDGLFNHSGPFCCWDSTHSEWCRRKAMYARTGWWFSAHGTMNSDLNAVFKRVVQRQRMFWTGIKGVVSTQMKFRPTMFGVEDTACSKTCPNGGTCILSKGKFRCRCAFGYTGRRCETSLADVKPCLCFNGGTCLSDNSCACPEGYTGNSCEKAIESDVGDDSESSTKSQVSLVPPFPIMEDTLLLPNCYAKRDMVWVYNITG